MQPGSQRFTSELNNTIDDLSGERCTLIGWVDMRGLKQVGVRGLYSLPAIADAFVNNRSSHISGDVEGHT